MVNLEDGPGDVLLKVRKLAGLRVFQEFSADEQLEWLNTNTLSPGAMPPHYAHDGNTVAKWLECHGCLSISIGFLVLSYLSGVGIIPFSYILFGTPIVSFGSIIIELRFKSR